MIDVAVVTCRALPEPDVDEGPLLAALGARGLAALLVAWDDPGVDWAACRIAIVRSTWNYHLDRDAFLAWSRRTASATRLYNPPSILEWNTDKAYLGELAARGVRTVPTEYVARGATRDLGALMDERGWRRVVVKPRVSAGSFDTHAYSRDELRGGELALRARERDVMVQPYVASVNEYGERSLVMVDGEITHAVRKSPRFAGGGESVAPVEIAPGERAFAASVLAALPESLLYARVDIAHDEQGQPQLMELELVEPSLFLVHSARASERLVEAAARLARG